MSAPRCCCCCCRRPPLISVSVLWQAELCTEMSNRAHQAQVACQVSSAQLGPPDCLDSHLRPFACPAACRGRPRGPA
jgi:hypothetical protein